MTRKRLPIAIALIAFCIAEPGIAADVTQLECPSASLTEAERSSAGLPVLERLAFGIEAQRPIALAAARCQRDHGWSEQATEDAFVYTLALLGNSIGRRRLADAGIDASELERRIEDRARGLSTSTAEQQESHAELALRLLGSRAQDRSLVEVFSTVIVLRARMERERGEFARH